MGRGLAHGEEEGGMRSICTILAAQSGKVSLICACLAFFFGGSCVGVEIITTGYRCAYPITSISLQMTI